MMADGRMEDWSILNTFPAAIQRAYELLTMPDSIHSRDGAGRLILKNWLYH